MKTNTLRNTLIALIILIGGMMYTPTFGQAEPPDLPGGGHGTDSNSVPGGGAPLGGGIFILSALAMTYGYGSSKFSSKPKDSKQ